jgi:hypothetical protein
MGHIVIFPNSTVVDPPPSQLRANGGLSQEAERLVDWLETKLSPASESIQAASEGRRRRISGVDDEYGYIFLKRFLRDGCRTANQAILVTSCKSKGLRCLFEARFTRGSLLGYKI